MLWDTVYKLAQMSNVMLVLHLSYFYERMLTAICKQLTAG